MSTQFFERQETQKSVTRWLVLGFIAAIVAVVTIINAIVLIGIQLDPVRTWRHNPEIVFWVTVVVAGTILIASWHKASQLRQGGGAVARSVGGVPVSSGDGDFARQRLLNVVEEMAIAARVRKPAVYVLPDEPGINAFAAGNSPDEAAIAVTQGALDTLDRDQLQAVIGHEFSHILNGDMKINMRLTALIFGLFVITDLASRVLRGRARGKKDARLYLVALGIFAAGSVGMFAGRLLRAAVSRRREHLADASAVQFTRNPQALQGAFIAMAAHAEGTRLVSTGTTDVAHMLIAGSDPLWANKFGGSWFATHPPLEERVRALDGRVTPLKFRTLVSDARRRLAAPATESSVPGKPSMQSSHDELSLAATGVTAALAPAPSTAAAPTPAADVAPSPSETMGLRLMATAEFKAPELQETLPTGVRTVGGRALPPDVLRNRLTGEQQSSITQFIADVESSPLDVQATFVAAMLASEPAKARTQLVKLAPTLGIELMKATQARATSFAQLAPAARLPLLADLLGLLDGLDPADRKRLRAIARAFAPTVAAGDMFRFTVTRLLEKRLAKASEPAAPVPLPERAADVCALFATLAHCRFGAGKQGTNAYRAGVMGMMPATMWAPYPETPTTIAQLDRIVAGLDQIHPTGKRSFSEGMARVLAVGGVLTVPQVDLLRGICLLIDCALPVVPVDVVYEDAIAAPRATHASAR
ncbi:MAG TPA: M48 family metallopeptidase [Steroidobacteraceae bacterium]|nr:M48 family metallopeptidase [Steroidobacteraceae bacterium]